MCAVLRFDHLELRVCVIRQIGLVMPFALSVSSGYCVENVQRNFRELILQISVLSPVFLRIYNFPHFFSLYCPQLVLLFTVLVCIGYNSDVQHIF